MLDARQMLEDLRQLPLYQQNLSWGTPRQGHPEGSLANHIAELEQNLERLKPLLQGSEEDMLRLVIHVHDICKPQARVGVDSQDPHNHARLARELLSQVCCDPVLLALTQYHDEGFRLYRYFRHSDRLPELIEELLEKVQQVELFMLFFLIDSCTAGKRPQPVDWWLGAVAAEYPLSARIGEARQLLRGA